MAKVSKAAIKRRLTKKGGDTSQGKKKRDMAKGNKKGWPGLRSS